MKYSKKYVIKEAKKLNKYKDFRENHRNLYLASIKYKYLDEIKSFFHKKEVKDKKQKSKKEKKEILKIASKCKSFQEFRIKHSIAYRKSIKLKILKQIKKRLPTIKKYKWSKQDIKNKALKYSVKSHFRIENSGMHKAAKRMNIENEIYKHMDHVGNHYYRMLYAFEFPDKSVYVGLTYNYNKRYQHHMKNNQKIINKTHKMGHTFIMYNKKFSKNLIGIEEKKMINKYKKNGWTILNIAKAGALGGKNRKISKEEILKNIKKYKTKSDLKKYDISTLYAIRRYKDPQILKEYNKLSNKFTIWNKKSAIKEARKYSSRKEFYTNSSGAYNFCKNNNIYEEACSHMIVKRIQWNQNNIKKEALKYNRKIDFQKKASGAYSAAKRLGIFNKVTLHMKK